MAALLLCELPAGSHEARSWILGQLTLLASRGQADCKFAGHEPAQSSREVLAIEVANVEAARALASAWRSDGRLSAVEMRVLQLQAALRAEFSVALFP